MKKFFFSVSIFVLFYNANAQNQYFGMKSGINISNVSAKEFFTESKSKYGFFGGLLYEVDISNQYTFGTQIIFSETGFLDEIVLTDEQGNVIQNGIMMRFNYNYLSVPLTIGYRIGRIFFVVTKAGLQPSILLEAKTYIPEIEANGLVLESETLNVTESVSTFDIAGVIGVDVNYILYNRLVLFSSFEGKYSISKFSNKNYFDQYNLRHYLFAFSIGVKYGLATDH